jgi:hypothetical protein
MWTTHSTMLWFYLWVCISVKHCKIFSCYSFYNFLSLHTICYVIHCKDFVAMICTWIFVWHCIVFVFLHYILTHILTLTVIHLHFSQTRPIICYWLFPITIISAAWISNRYRYQLCQKKQLIGKLQIMDTDYCIG